nr:phosphotransferase [Conexibacter arvalis]
MRRWGIEARRLEYAPVGFGDHHWRAKGADGRRWFLSVAALDSKPVSGDGAEAALDGLRRAMATARALRDAGVAAVVAPEPARDGETVVALGAGYALSVFEHVEGSAGSFAQERTPAERRATIELLASLHRMPAPPRTPRIPWDPPARATLERALGELDSAPGAARSGGPDAAPDAPRSGAPDATPARSAPGAARSGGPYAEPARAALAAAAPRLRTVLAGYDRQVAELVEERPAVVVTHGEPHPGNLIVAPDGQLRLIDWDTVGLAVPERDLWSVVRDDADLDLYERLTGHRPRRELLDLFRLRWDLGDVGELLGWFRAPHGRDEDADAGWRDLAELLRRVGGEPG